MKRNAPGKVNTMPLVRADSALILLLSLRASAPILSTTVISLMTQFLLPGTQATAVWSFGK